MKVSRESEYAIIVGDRIVARGDRDLVAQESRNYPEFEPVRLNSMKVTPARPANIRFPQRRNTAAVGKKKPAKKMATRKTTVAHGHVAQ